MQEASDGKLLIQYPVKIVFVMLICATLCIMGLQKPRCCQLFNGIHGCGVICKALEHAQVQICCEKFKSPVSLLQFLTNSSQ